MTTDTITRELTYTELAAQYEAAAAELESIWDDSTPAERAAANAKCGELFERLRAAQPWTLFATCLGGPVLLVEANEDTARLVAEALDITVDGFCGQCGDYSSGAVNLPDAERPVVGDDCVVVEAGAIDAFLA